MSVCGSSQWAKKHEGGGDLPLERLQALEVTGFHELRDVGRLGPPPTGARNRSAPTTAARTLSATLRLRFRSLAR